MFIEYWQFIIVLIVTAIVGAFLGFHKRTNKSNKDDWIATIIIDIGENPANGGSYLMWDEDPYEMIKQKKLKNEQTIPVNVLLADLTKSQENQGV